MIKKILSLLATCVILFTSCSPYGNLNKMEFEELDYPFPVQYAELSNEIKLAYIDEGSGPETIIFIHGLGSYLPAWKKNVAVLQKDFRCIAVDLPGYGKSSKGIYAATMEFYSDVIIEMMDKLGIQKATIAGHSMGGQTAIVMSLKYPDRVNKLILTAPAGFEVFTEGEKEWFREVMTIELVKSTSVKNIRANLMANFYDTPEDAEFMITDRIALRGAKDFDKYCYAVANSVNGMVDEPVFNLLERIQQPALIIFGENDNLIPNRFLNGGFTKDFAEAGHSKIPNSKLVMIPNCGHFVQFEKAEITNKEIINFLKN